MTRIDSEKEKIRRAKAREMSKRVAAFLSDFNDDLVEEGFDSSEAIVAILASTAPVVMDMAMKGIFK